ncbi:hypothetical protein NHB29_01095 [Pantoea agglomerans]|uniref:hypothetical protein n=1 Tax=Enterobacter agglomerans TaxID=549 RepID=UPI002738A9E9|nr:hypothetical protein [Pantoea agglomerans]WLO84848.1 hypothetical protein NHB29_01095 [Pantoea agglomerans]
MIITFSAFSAFASADLNPRFALRVHPVCCYSSPSDFPVMRHFEPEKTLLQ